ncbi:peptidoglycan editing factor PgeF [Salinibacillus aidingensis]|uniref:Purine nucleoside phosphorylase n=1 Tax=Salinibacillus aidingensis TaxID=237684 RepID=A0ABP3L7U9_9BACI
MSELFSKSRTSSYLEIPDWKKKGITAGITTRKGGFSQQPYDTLNMGFHVQDDYDLVLKNYERMENIIGIPARYWISSKQVHRTDVLEWDDSLNRDNITHPPNFELEYDGWMTNQRNVLLTGVFADCVPLFFRSEEWVALAHAGWKGTVKGMGPKVIDHFLTHQVPLEEIEVVVGPSISSRHYEVDHHVVQHIPFDMQTEDVLTRSDETHYYLDLKQLHKNLLLKKGLKEQQITLTNYCTYENEDLFYSHRRDQGKTGRMMAFIGFE